MVSGPGSALGNRRAARRVGTGVDLDLPFRGSDAVRAGEVGRRALQGPGFRRLGPDVHVRATTVVDVRVRSLAALVRHPDGVVAGLAAAAAWGVWAGGVDRVDVLLTRRVREVGDLMGVRGVRDRWAEDEVTASGGLRLTDIRRTAYDVARRLPRSTSLAVLDAIARLHGLPVPEVEELVRRYPRAGNARLVGPMCRLADPHSPDAATSMLRADLARHVRERARIAPVLEVGGHPVQPALVWDADAVAVFVERDSPVAQRGIALLRSAGWWIAPPDAAVIPLVLARARGAASPSRGVADDQLDVDEWDEGEWEGDDGRGD